MIGKINQQWKQILKLYKALPYIIFRNEYLIPSPPYKPAINPIYNIHPLKVLEKQYPSLMKNQYYYNKDNNQYKDLFKKIYRQQKEKQKLEYQQKMKEYKSKMMVITKIFVKYYPAALFYEEQLKGTVYKGKGEGFKQRKLLYKNLDVDKRLKYERLSQQLIRQQRQKYKDLHLEYRIPIIQEIKPIDLFQLDLQKQNISIHTNAITAKFVSLNIQQIKKYNQKSQQIKQNQKKKLLDFLKQKNLDQNKFQYIKMICQKMKKIKSEYNQIKKQQKLSIKQHISKKQNQFQQLKQTLKQKITKTQQQQFELLKQQLLNPIIDNNKNKPKNNNNNNNNKIKTTKKIIKNNLNQKQ